MKRSICLNTAEATELRREGSVVVTRKVAAPRSKHVRFDLASPRTFADSGGTIFGPGPYLHVPFVHRENPEEWEDAPMLRVRCPWSYPEDGAILAVREPWAVADHDFGRPYPSAWLLQAPDRSFWWRNPPESEQQRYAEQFGTASTTGGPDPRQRPAARMPAWAVRCRVRVERVEVGRDADRGWEWTLGLRVESPTRAPAARGAPEDASALSGCSGAAGGRQDVENEEQSA